MKRSWLKGLKVGGGVFAFAFVGIGALHMPFARSFLMRVGGCPVVKATPEVLEAARVAANAKNNHSTVLAPARPALGFNLEQTTIADVKAWSAANNVSCNLVNEDTVMLCSDVPSALVGEDGPNVEEVQFDFRPSDKKLNIVSTFRKQMTAPQAALVLNHIGATMQKQIGEPTLKRGVPSLDSGEPHAYVIAYNFKNYRADASGMDLGTHGFAIREHFINENN